MGNWPDQQPKCFVIAGARLESREDASIEYQVVSKKIFAEDVKLTANVPFSAMMGNCKDDAKG